MSAYCPGCGNQTEEDDNRICSGCTRILGMDRVVFWHELSKTHTDALMAAVTDRAVARARSQIQTPQAATAKA